MIKSSAVNIVYVGLKNSVKRLLLMWICTKWNTLVLRYIAEVNVVSWWWRRSIAFMRDDFRLAIQNMHIIKYGQTLR